MKAFLLIACLGSTVGTPTVILGQNELTREFLKQRQESERAYHDRVSREKLERERMAQKDRHFWMLCGAIVCAGIAIGGGFVLSRPENRRGIKKLFRGRAESTDDSAPEGRQS